MLTCIPLMSVVLVKHCCRNKGLLMRLSYKREILPAIKPGLIHIFYMRKCLYQVGNTTFFIHSFDVYERLILPFDCRLSALNFSWSLVLL